MIKFNTLSNTNNREILDCFNHSFSDYSIPFNLNIHQLESKFAIENINKEISVGAFNGGNLIGFVLHGSRVIKGKKMAYNGGTGVMPEERGAALTSRMYAFILPKMMSKGFEKILLEVISDNIPAIKSYRKIGFVPIRNLDCFKGEIGSKNIHPEIKINENSKESIELLSIMGEVKPSWQNSNKSIQNLGNSGWQILAYLRNELVGYCILNSNNNRILQIAVKKEFRNKRIGSTMLQFVKDNISKETSIINVDTKAELTINFFQSNHLNKSLSQIEMVLKIGGN